MKNPIVWLEIAATDLERAKVFYGKVFGLEFKLIDMPDQKMYAFGSEDPNTCGSSGCLMKSEYSKPSTEGTIVYFSCEDLSVELARVEEAGGKIIIPKTDIGEFGFFAHIIDTEGNKIGLHSIEKTC
ncbi:MAG: hypothetical protein CR982_10475 [Candidatus Cloacimonadota bacterium]|nr:MAG: hypothetical protein CR982_10475 [Candidatus Cloacimonadota bacterium]PIE79002.1 MAG: hypothetical protein CSA15_04935 [Candidatus Delongbacteria bacterium]